MGKTIRFGENGLIAIKKKLNEIMVGTDSVSHNDVCGSVKLYHGTDIPALLAILKTNRVCANDGVQHGETHGLNWFSLENDGSFNRGACFSIEVPANEFNTIFQKMNSAHVISRESSLDVSNYNIQVEHFCGFNRNSLINLYKRLVERDEHYPLEWIRDDVFYNWCEKSGNEDTYMQTSDYDFGLIMSNILGEDTVRKEGFIEESTINEVSPEVDEYTIGGEEKNGDVVAGGNYLHAVNEGYCISKLKNIDLSEVGKVECETYFDEDEYNEWLQDNELVDSQESRVKFYTEEITYDVTYLDNEIYHCMDTDSVFYDDLEELFGEDMAQNILNGCMKDEKYSFETYELYANNTYNLSNPYEVNNIAMKLFRHGGYYKNCRGFILTNGVIVYTEAEHNEICMIPGVETKFQFIEMGNIRILPNSIDIGSEPTYEQEEVLREVIAAYSDDELYLDIFSEHGEIGVKYINPDWRYVIGEIDRYYSDGIRPQGSNGFYENKEKSENLIAEIKNIPQAFIDRAIELRPDKWHNWVVIDLIDINRVPFYFMKRQTAYDHYKFVKMDKESIPVMIDLDKISPISENTEKEVESSEVDLSSFKKRDTLPPRIWKDGDTLDSKVRLKLLDIADDFWEFVNLTWVEPKGIIITGSICNFNWSQFSDIDLHLIVDFNEVDSKTDFVREYLDSKKNEWNNEHEDLKIMGFPVELYVQDISENPEAGGIYDLEENKWIRKPNPGDIKSIGLTKFNIKDKAAEIMTIIDDMSHALESTNDGHEIEQIGDDASYLWKKVKNLRKKSLSKNGESGAGNIVYKVLRREFYLDKLWKLRTLCYDKLNSI